MPEPIERRRSDRAYMDANPEQIRLFGYLKTALLPATSSSSSSSLLLSEPTSAEVYVAYYHFPSSSSSSSSSEPGLSLRHTTDTVTAFTWNQFMVGEIGDFVICDLVDGVWVFIQVAGSTGAGGGGGTGCGCCDCFDCVNVEDAVVGGCTAAPNGATYEYTFDMGSSTFQPYLFGEQTFYNCAPQGCAGSSSSSSGYSSSSSSAPVGCCQWYTCPISVCAEVSSSSSSSSLECGTYQWVLDMSVSPPTITLVLLSGTDVMGAD